MKSIDIKINNAKRRAEAERQQSTPKPTPTMGLTIPRSTPENGAPMKKRTQDLPRATELETGHAIVISASTGGAIRNILSEIGAAAAQPLVNPILRVSPIGAITSAADRARQEAGEFPTVCVHDLDRLSGVIDSALACEDSTQWSDRALKSWLLHSKSIGVDLDLTPTKTVRSIIAEQAGQFRVMRVKMPDFDLAEGDSFELFSHFGAARDISVYIKFDNAGQAFVEMAYVKA